LNLSALFVVVRKPSFTLVYRSEPIKSIDLKNIRFKAKMLQCYNGATV